VKKKPKHKQKGIALWLSVAQKEKLNLFSVPPPPKETDNLQIMTGHPNLK